MALILAAVVGAVLYGMAINYYGKLTCSSSAGTEQAALGVSRT